MAGGTAYSYVFDGATRLARAGHGSDLLYYHHDLVASTDSLSDAHGTLVRSNAFFPFGAVRDHHTSGVSDEGAAPQYLFAQKERDLETRLFSFDARHLNPALARFIQVDPVILGLPPDALEAPQILNGYAFASNNPLHYGDSSGKFVETAWDVVSLGMSLAAYNEDPSVLNAVSVIVDTAALVVPGLPGGAGAAAKAGKGTVGAVKRFADTPDVDWFRRLPSALKERPKGLEGWIAKPAKDGIGIKYHPPVKNPQQHYVRVMKGRPEAKFKGQQVDYVRLQKHGKPYDRAGKKLRNPRNEDAHIPLKEFEVPGGLFDDLFK